MTDLIDRTAELFETHPEFLADNALVILTSAALTMIPATIFHGTTTALASRTTAWKS